MAENIAMIKTCRSQIKAPLPPFVTQGAREKILPALDIIFTRSIHHFSKPTTLIAMIRENNLRRFARDAKMRLEKSVDLPRGLGRRDDAVSAGHDFELCFHAGPLQGLVKQPALPDGHERVLFAVQNEEWRGILGDVIDGIGERGPVEFIRERAAEESGNVGAGIVAKFLVGHEFIQIRGWIKRAD